jgi:hypothetical protein
MGPFGGFLKVNLPVGNTPVGERRRSGYLRTKVGTQALLSGRGPGLGVEKKRRPHMPWTSKEDAALIVAGLAALVALLGSLISVSVAFGVQWRAATATAERERVAFRRSQQDRLVNLGLDGAIRLEAQFEASGDMPWLRASKEAPLADQAFQCIAQIRYAVRGLVAMGSVPDAKVPEAEDSFSQLERSWRDFASAREAYRIVIVEGSAQPGSSRAVAAGQEYQEQRRLMGIALGRLRRLFAVVHVEIGGRPTK